MPRYFFHVDDGVHVPDLDGTECWDLDDARAQGLVAAGEMLKDVDGNFWKDLSPWTMHVTDDANRLQFSLMFAAKIPSGEVAYVPSAPADD